MSVLKKRQLPHVRPQQTNKHNAFKLFFIEQIQMQFVFTLHLPPGNNHKLILNNCIVSVIPWEEQINDDYVHTQKRVQTRTNFVPAFKITVRKDGFNA